jgi:hypothetical protein
MALSDRRTHVVPATASTNLVLRKTDLKHWVASPHDQLTAPRSCGSPDLSPLRSHLRAEASMRHEAHSRVQ